MPDLIGDLLGLDALAPVARLRAERPGIRQHVEGTCGRWSIRSCRAA